MAEKQELEITINKKGDVQIHVQGVDGKSCLEMTKELEEALGIVTLRENTSEFYKQENTQESEIHGESGK